MRLKPENAEIGMYVRKFAGSWLNHPFWRAHFVIESDEDLQKVRSAGTDFFIDVSKSVSTKPIERKTSHRELAEPCRANASAQRPAGIIAAPVRPRRVSRSTIAPPTFGKADKARAAALAQRSSQVVKSLFDDCRLGRSVSTDEILSVVQDIGDILEKNSSALISVTRLKSKDEYTYTHSVAVCALMINLGRETGATGDALESLGVAGLLHDIGKVRIDQTILQKDGPLTDLEKLQIDKHPEFGHQLLSAEPRVPAVALDVCLHHHERLDGTGYPFGLSGDDISSAVRMAAICDVYDAATSDRPYKLGKTPIETITEMYERPEHFDAEMLFRFMRSIGVFPVGKLIRLRSNRLGVALPCAKGDARPVIRAFYSTVNTCFIDCVDVILSANMADDQAISSEDPVVWFSENWYDIYIGIVGSVSRPS